MVNCAADALTTDRAAAIAARLSLNAQSASEHKGISLSSILKREHSPLGFAMRCHDAACMAAASACMFLLLSWSALQQCCGVWSALSRSVCFEAPVFLPCRVCRPCALLTTVTIAYSYMQPRAVQSNLLHSRCTCGTVHMKMSVLEPPAD